MTPPSWLTDKAVKVYAAKCLPVARVKDGEPFALTPYGEKWQQVRAAWERLEYKLWDDSKQPGEGGIIRSDGFYYLEPGGARVPDLIPGATLPELVPCEDMAEKCWPVFVIGSIRDLFDFRDFRDTAALVFHREARECEQCCGEGNMESECGSLAYPYEPYPCKKCLGQGTLPEQIHVETREDGET